MHLSLSVWEVPSTWPFLEWFGNTYDVVVPMPMMVRTVLLTRSLCERWCWEAIVLWLWVSLLLAQCVAHSWEAIVCRSKWCVVLLTVLLTVEKQLWLADKCLERQMPGRTNACTGICPPVGQMPRRTNAWRGQMPRWTNASTGICPTRHLSFEAFVC